MLLILAAVAAVSASFEGGALKSYEWVAPDHLVARIPGQSDHDGRNHQPSWFYFSISGVRGRDLTIDLAGWEGEYNYKPHDGSGHRNTRPAISYDDKNWRHVESAEWLANPARLRVKLRAEQDRVYIARIPPYTLKNLDALRNDTAGSRLATWSETGRSVRGRPLYRLDVRDAALRGAKKHVWVMARQHAWEAGTSWVAEGAIRFLLGGSDEARRLLAANEFHFLPLCDPDGVSGGQVRFNANGYDLNRNWDVDDAGRMPEIAALKRAILAGPKPDVFLAIHNTESVDYIAGALDRGGERVRGVGAFLNSSLNQETYFHAPAGARNSADEPAAGRMTAPEWVFRNTGAPAFLMELMVDTNPKLGRPVETRERIQLGAALARILAASVSQPSL